jgi:tetraprenyl-beta-curcumene synthase
MTPQATAPPVRVLDAMGVLDRLRLTGAFAGAARRYWVDVFPAVRHERSRWRKRAAEIPNPLLRTLALAAEDDGGNVEGAAAFAAFVPRTARGAVVRALVAYQSTYNYLDVLAEQPSADPVAGTRGLHQALLDALDPAGWVETESPGTGTESNGGAPDYYADYPQREDGGYLAALVRECRTSLAALPSYAVVAPAARRATERIVQFQSLNLSVAQGAHDAFAHWASGEAPSEIDLEWWETAAAGGSSLGVYALIAAAADPIVDPREIAAIEDAYFPWIGALHSLLDHLVDRVQDARVAQRNLLDYYASPAEAAARMQTLAQRAASAANGLPRARAHTVVLAGMTAYYLSDPGASAPAAAPIAHDVRRAIGGLVAPALVVFRARRLVGALGRASARRATPRRRAPLRERDTPVALRLQR